MLPAVARPLVATAATAAERAADVTVPFARHNSIPTGPYERFFYRGLPYGSDATFQPLREVINGAFGILQISSNWKTLDRIDWRNGLSVTWRSITHPTRTIGNYGWRDFATSEMLPGRLSWQNLQYVPNYTLHLVGGGARNRAFVEWYRAHGVPYPVWMAMATTIVHEFAVETVEHAGEHAPTVDPIADMLFFDPAGALLFLRDGVSRFFAHTLHMSIWSGQPMINPAIHSIENAGQNYAFHYFFSGGNRAGLFTYLGMSNLFGVTVRNAGGVDWSFGLGGNVAELTPVERGRGGSAFFARLSWDAGLFAHVNGSLLVSVLVSQSWAQRLRVNVYPGVVSLGGVTPGIYVGVRRSTLLFGVSLHGLPVGGAYSG